MLPSRRKPKAEQGAAGQPQWLLSLFPCFTLTSTSTLLQTLSAATAVPALERSANFHASLAMNGRTGLYNKWPKIGPGLSTALGRVQDRLISRHLKWLKRHQITLDCTVWEMTGCTSDTFYHHFNELFEEGMTWLNYGDWQIDHIFPLAAVDSSDTSSILGAFNYMNLRPVWAPANSTKGATVSSPRPLRGQLTRGHPDFVQRVPAHQLQVL
jgi:hypothetical protein